MSDVSFVERMIRSIAMLNVYVTNAIGDLVEHYSREGQNSTVR